MERRLAAILAADVVGYLRLMRVDEESPDWPARYILLASPHMDDARWGWVDDREEALADGFAAFESAVERDPTLPLAFAGPCYGRMLAGEFDTALDLIRKGVTLGPSNGDALHVAAMVANFCGCPQEGLGYAKHAMRVVPMAQSNILTELGHAHLLVAEPHRAIAPLRQALALSPFWASARCLLIRALEAMGDAEGAHCLHRPCGVSGHPGLRYTRRQSGAAIGTELLVESQLSRINDLLAKGDAGAAYSLGAGLAAENPDHARLAFLTGNAALQLGQYEDAVTYFERADALHPDAAQIKNNLGAAQLHKGDIETAIATLKRAVALKPDYSNARTNLASALKSAGLYGQAEAQLDDIRNREGDTLELVAELAELYRLQERWEEASDAYQALFEHDPSNAQVREAAVNALLRLGDADAAEELAARDLPPGRAGAEALALCGDVFLKANNRAQAVRLFTGALAADPATTAARLGLGEIYRSAVPRWHFSMLNDAARNEAYDGAIRRAVKPGDIVLDIGTGSGLLAMMAARAGAEHVYTCEGVPLIAAKAREIVAANGFADRITVLSKWSHAVVAGDDMVARADVLVSEIVDNLLIGEGIMATLEHALTHLVKPDARILPRAGRLHAVPVECDRLFWRDRCDTSSGFDVTAFGAFTRYGNFSSDMVREGDYRELGEAAELFAFDFTSPGFSTQRSRLDLTCARAGTLHGAMVWFELEIDDVARINNHPERGREHWGVSFVFLDAPREVEAGDRVALEAEHDTTTVDFRFVE